MSHLDPHHDPENVREADSKFAPKALSKALKKAFGYGTSLKHKRAWAKTYKAAGSKTDARYLEKGPIRRGPAGMYN